MIHNINDRATVTLTPAGSAQWAAYHSQFGRPDLFKTPTGRYEAPFWELMGIFGAKMFMGCTEQMFVDNVIEMKED